MGPTAIKLCCFAALAAWLTGGWLMGAPGGLRFPRVAFLAAKDAPPRVKPQKGRTRKEKTEPSLRDRDLERRPPRLWPSSDQGGSLGAPRPPDEYETSLV